MNGYFVWSMAMEICYLEEAFLFSMKPYKRPYFAPYFDKLLGGSERYSIKLSGLIQLHFRFVSNSP